MALSGKVGASLVRLNRAACAPSLNFETLRSAFSAVSPSMMSHPVRNASAPRLAAPRRKPRRLASGISLAASVISSFGSTTGMVLCRRMVFVLTAGDHGAQTFRHDQRERNVNDQERDDCRHRKKVDIARDIIPAEQRRQFLKLHGLPYRKPGQDDDYSREYDACIEQLLDRVVTRQVVMREAKGRRSFKIRHDVGWPNRPKLAPEPAAGETQR